MARDGFIFYESFRDATKGLPDDTRLLLYDALTDYALYGTEPDLADDAVALGYFKLMRPQIDANNRRRENGLHGGRPAGSSGGDGHTETEAKPNNNRSETEAETKGKGKRKGKSNEKAHEKEQGRAQAGKPPAHARGAFGYVKLTDDEHDRLIADLGAEEAARVIAYIDESAATTGNKNKWRDWNLVLRKASREGWGRKASQEATQSHVPDYSFAGFRKGV